MAELFAVDAAPVWMAEPVAEVLRAAALEPVHAYLFLGPRGSGKREAAHFFAGLILAAGDPEGGPRHLRLSTARQHPDVGLVVREGASIRVEQAAEVVRLASLKPVESDRKILILDEFHLVVEATAGKLLKTVEEPPLGTVFIVLAEEISPELVTIASRCSVMAFPALTESQIVASLMAGGMDRASATEISWAAQGDLERAQGLAGDERIKLRLQAWAEIPRRLDGSGNVVTEIVDELQSQIDDAARALEAHQAEKVAEMQEQVERYGLRGSGAKALEESHKRQLRRLRTDELRMGLGELARHYRDVVVSDAPAGSTQEVLAASKALDRIWAAADSLIRNPNEALWLQALLLGLARGPGR